MTTGTIVDATEIHAPFPPKAATRAGIAEMHQRKNGKNYYFGIIALLVGLHRNTKIIHTPARHQYCEQPRWTIQGVPPGFRHYRRAGRLLYRH
ncbi:MAG: hypothetical protein JOZ36_01980 [Acidobacteria bacterium]|nr:hypothetical protein [Acidobacteriota bacterium]